MVNIYNRTVGLIDDISVMNDCEVVKIEFKCLNQVTDLLKLTECDKVYINYQNGATKDRYLVTDLTQNGEEVTFSWTLGANATKNQGKTFFVICAQITEGAEIKQEWNTVLASFNVHKGLETITAETPDLEDIFSQLINMIDGKQDKGDYVTETELNTELAKKQNELTAGQNITIVNDVISATGGTVDAYTKAETDALLADKQDKGNYATSTELSAEASARQNADLSLQGQIDAKLNINQGAANVGKALIVNSSGNAVPQDIPQGTTDYTELSNKPSINGVTLSGNKSLADLGSRFVATYTENNGSYTCDKTLAQILDAIEDGNIVVANLGGMEFTLSVSNDSFAAFITVLQEGGSKYLLAIAHEYVDSSEEITVVQEVIGGAEYIAGQNITINNGVISSGMETIIV